MTVELTAKSCKPCEGGVPAMTEEEVLGMLPQVGGWTYVDGNIEKAFDFNNYYQTISFVNAVAWIANAEGHHPNMQVDFRRCTVRYWTHAIDGMSENDFICAAKINQLME